MTKKEARKNGLVELFRFLCSVWVAYYHGFFPILSDKFDGVNISVDFFFMVSGVFFLKSINKYTEQPFLNGFRHITWGKTKSFIVPLAIAACSILACNLIFELDFGGFNWPLSFLWFFAAQFVFLSVFYLILKKVKKLSTFNLICAGIILLSMSLCAFMSLSFAKQFDRVFRTPAMIGIGILISQIPKIKIVADNERKAEKLSIILNGIGFAISAAAFIYLAYLPDYRVGRAHLFTCVICPLLLYFATSLPVNGKVFDLLGELSIFIYLAQCPILLHYYAGTSPTTAYFGWLCFYAVALFTINRVVNYFTKKKKTTL
jgi:hypothetical protein